MKKSFSMFVLFLLTMITQTALAGVTFAQLSNSKCYTLTTARGYLWTTDEGVLSASNPAAPANEDQKKFAIISYNGDLYLWSVSAGKFLVLDGTGACTRNTNISVLTANDVTYSENGYIKFTLGGKTINFNGSNDLSIDGWSTTDAGNSFTVEEAGDFDAATALEILSTPIFDVNKKYALKDVNTDLYFTLSTAAGKNGNDNSRNAATISEVPTLFTFAQVEGKNSTFTLSDDTRTLGIGGLYWNFSNSASSPCMFTELPDGTYSINIGGRSDYVGLDGIVSGSYVFTNKGQVNKWAVIPTYAISGKVTKSDTPVAGATVTLTGVVTVSATTDAEGAYTIKVISGNYNVNVTSNAGVYTGSYEVTGDAIDNNFALVSAYPSNLADATPYYINNVGKTDYYLGSYQTNKYHGVLNTPSNDKVAFKFVLAAGDASHEYVYIYDCNAGKYIKFTSTDNGNGKVVNCEEAERSLFVFTSTGTEGQYFIQPVTESEGVYTVVNTALNCYGGVNFKDKSLGFYNGYSTDAGSKWTLQTETQVLDAEKAAWSSRPDPATMNHGSSLGNYTQASWEAYRDAKAAFDADETRANLYAAYVAYNSLAFSLPEVGHLYRIKSYVTAQLSSTSPAYVMNVDGNLTMAKEKSANELENLWIACQNESGKYYFQSAVGDGKMLNHSSASSATPSYFTISTGQVKDPLTFALHSANLNGGRFLSGGYRDSAYKLGNAIGSGFYAASQTQSGDFSTDFVFEENTDYHIYNIAITGIPTGFIAQATIDGKTAGNGGSIVLQDELNVGNLASKVQATEIAGYNYTLNYNDGTVTIAYALSNSIFSESTANIKARVRISNVRAAYSIYANSGNALHSHSTDYTDPNELFALVGTRDEFRLYSITQEKFFGYANSNQDTPVTADGTTQTFKLVADPNGNFYIVPTGNETQSLNMHGGNGNDIKFYGVSDGGSNWKLYVVNKEVEGGVVLIGQTKYTNTNTKMGIVSTTLAGVTSTRTYTPTDAGVRTYYITEGFDFSQNVQSVFRGYTAEKTTDYKITFTADEEGEFQYLFYSTDHGRPYRIPAIAKNINGELIALSDDRYCGSDIGNGRVDIVGRISTDNGVTWGDQFNVAVGDGNNNSNTCGYGDAAIVADRESNKVMMMCVSAPSGGTCWTAAQRGVISVSTDGGHTWPTPVDIKDQICNTESSLLPGVRNYFVGSGKLHQSRYIKVGDYYRVYAALWTTPDGSAINNYVIYTDDFGSTWHLLGTAGTPCVNGGNEPKCEEMPDGSVVISSRAPYKRMFNVFTYDKENNADFSKGTWDTQVNGVTNGDGHGTDGEILIVQAKKSDDTVVPVAIQSTPDHGRENVTIWYKELTANSRLSDLEGAWTKGKQVSHTSSAYSTMCIQQDKRIAFFFEEGPAGYEMVYVPFNIADITNGQYVDIIQDYSAPVRKAAEEANKELQKAGKVGYPSMSSASYRTLSDAIRDAANVDGADATACKEARTAIQTALTAYYAETNITLPLRGKVYRFRGSNFKNTFDEADDEWAYLNDTNNKHVAHIAASPNANGMFMQEEVSEASNWLCISADPEANEFKFVSANGNNFGYQTITEQPAVVKITRAIGNQWPKVNGIAPYNNMFGFVNMKVGDTWMCAISVQDGGAWNMGDRSNGIGGNSGLDFPVTWQGKLYYPDWRIEEVEDAGAQAYVKKYADIQLNVIGNPINSEYNALKTLVDQTADHELNEVEEEAMFQATANYLNSMKTGYADANTANAIVLPTGYYHIRNAKSNRYLFNDKNYTSSNVTDATRMTWAASKASSYYVAHSDHNNLVWKITRHDDGVTFDIQNGQGTPMLKNGEAYTSLTFTHYNAQNHSVYFSQGLHDQGNGTEDNGAYGSGKSDGVHYIVNWAYTNDASSYWIFEPVDDKDFWTVNIYDTNDNTHAMKEHTGCSAPGTAYIYNGGFAGYPAGATVDGSDISTSRDAEVAAGTLMKNITANDASKTITICFGTEMYTQTNQDHATLMTNVLNYLQYSGLGYPKATSQARRDLYKAISMCDRLYTGNGEHAVNGSLITIEYLQTCLDNFVNDVDVELPVAGHVYTFRSTVGDNNHYVVDTNVGYNINPIKGDANGFAFKVPTQNGHLQSGGYWLCTSVAANGTCIFRSAEGNWLGSNAIATSEAAAQKILFAKGNGFGNLLMRQDVSGKYMASNSDNTIGTADSPVASAAQTTDWKVSAPDMNYVYFINITSNKPRTYANQIYNVTVSMTGTVDGYKFTETTSGAGFFVVDDAVLAPAANTTCSTNDLPNFYKNNDETVANRPTATINKTNKTIDVHYTFDYQTAIRELYSQAIDLKEHDDEFGWPKDDSPTLQRYKEAVFENTNNDSWTDRCYDKVNNTFKGGVNQEDAYNDLANLMMQFESGVPDDEINLPQNGSSVLLTNVFTNNAIHEEYQNYLYHDGDQLKLGMTSEQKAELKFGVNIIPSEPSDAFFWVIQRDDENTVTRVKEIITSSTDYSGDDRYTITENNRVHLTAQAEIAAAAAKFGSGEFTSTDSIEVGNNTTRVITTDVLVESTTTPVETRDAATYTGGTETPEQSYISLNGNYKTRRTYGEHVVERVVTETTVRSPLFYVVDGSGNVTNETTTDNTGYPVYVLDGSGNPTDVQATTENTTTTTEYYNVERRVNMIDQVVSVQRRYPSYYIATRVGDGYIGKATGGYNNTVKTNDRDKQFNVAFVRGTKLGTVGILYMLSANDGQPRYIVGNLEGSKLDRYNTQVAYDTEKATSSNGIWSTDWNFIQARNADTHTDADFITVNEVLVKQDGEAIKHDQITESWTNPINPGHTVKFGASQSISGDVKNPVFGAAEDAQQSYASLNLPFAVDLPHETTQHIYILTALKETDYSTRKTLLLTDIKDKLLVDFDTNPDDDVHKYHYILPRETPVLIMNNTDVTYHYGVANAFSSYVTSEKLAEVNTALAANKFKGTLAKVDSPTGSPYILARKKATQVDGKYKGAQPYTVAFYPLAQGSYLAANKAYIDFDDIIIEPKPAGVKGAMWTIDDEVESTTDIETLVPDLIIEMDTETGEIYDIQGRKLNDAPQHGVYIQNGKKYIAK